LGQSPAIVQVLFAIDLSAGIFQGDDAAWILSKDIWVFRLMAVISHCGDIHVDWRVSAVLVGYPQSQLGFLRQAIRWTKVQLQQTRSASH
jgi:hypothetical protein